MRTIDKWEEKTKNTLSYDNGLSDDQKEFLRAFLALISLIRKKDAGLLSAKKFMNDAWDGKTNSWKFRPGWDDANQKIMDAIALTDSLGMEEEK